MTSRILQAQIKMTRDVPVPIVVHFDERHVDRATTSIDEGDLDPFELIRR
jgi:hypothetical protein